jgi:acyl carrier protein
MSDEVVTFTVDALRQMNFDVEDADRETVFGPAGVDLDSMAVAELALRIEDAYGVKFSEEDMEGLAVMTIGEFATEVTARSDSLVSPLPAHRPHQDGAAT